MPVLPSHQTDEPPETSTEAGTTAGNWPPRDGDLRDSDCTERGRDEEPAHDEPPPSGP